MIKAMLAGSVRSDAEAERYIQSDQWVANEKIDGHRVMMAVTSGTVKVFNRDGKIRQHPTPKPIIDSFAQFPWDAIFDGELMDGVYHLFDLPLLAKPGDDEPTVEPSSTYADRLQMLDTITKVWCPDNVHLVPAYRTPDEKRALVQFCMDDGREGVMFKKLTARYSPQTRGPYTMKYKFRDDADVVVHETGLEGKENMSLRAWDPDKGKLVDVGRCTARAGDGDKIKPGDVITVNYAYFSSGGRLVQATLPRLRPGDKNPEECTIDQFRRAFGK